ncbi:hypothetical protein [uncultured Tolumonas sp.]|uniref:hypothetical protein n=1 Tax=uncultured Tolumonas sp. TaxID=263765 RepID=UPI00292E67E5|nr:hypothetical protein [uncultured Tolumonas sp.]
MNTLNEFKNRINALQKRKDLMSSLHNHIKLSESEITVISSLMNRLHDEIVFTRKLLNAAQAEEKKAPTPKKKKPKSRSVYTVSGGLPSLGKRR